MIPFVSSLNQFKIIVSYILKYSIYFDINNMKRYGEFQFSKLKNYNERNNIDGN